MPAPMPVSGLGPLSPARNRPQSAWTAVVAIAFACGAAVDAHAQAVDDPTVSTRADAVEADTKPGDDFFSYANGVWLRTTEIPAGKGRWGAGSEIADQTRRQVAKLLDDARSAPPGSDARKVADFRAAYLNDAAIEARGITPLKPLLGHIDRVRDKAALTRLLGGELRSDVDPMNQGVYDSSHVLGLAVQAGNHGEKRYVAYLLQGGAGAAGSRALPRHRSTHASAAAAVSGGDRRHAGAAGSSWRRPCIEHGAQGRSGDGAGNGDRAQPCDS